MKRFIDESGKFEIQIPEHWRYLLKNNKVHTFQSDETDLYDTLQISVNDPEDQSGEERFANLAKKLIRTSINGREFYSFPDKTGNEFIVKTWLTLIDRKLCVFTLTYHSNQNKNLEKRLRIIRKAISSFSLIEEGKAKSKLNSYRFENFMQGIAATAYMVNKAIEGKSFIEATCLFASQIDALFRTGIILQEQIINKNRAIKMEWIYQGINDKKKTEKDVYKRALELHLIDKTFFDELYKLYGDRNRIIHRFIISEITLGEVEKVAFQYYLMVQKVNKIVYKIESKQIKLGIGMTKQGDNPKKIDPIKFIKGKIGKINYFDKENKQS